MFTISMSTLTRKAYRSDVTDAQWRRLKRLLPQPAATGHPRSNEREVLSGILYVLSTGCRWEDMPHDIGASYQTCNRRLLDYQRRRVWQKMLGELMKEADRKGRINLRNAYHEASVIKSKRGRKTK
jgi:putative transposase